MSCNQDDEWEYTAVETADDVMICGDSEQCKRLKNWSKWLSIRKQQHKHLGLMVRRSTTSLLMNESDRFRSKVECQWMVDQAQKLKINNEFKKDYRPYSVTREVENFTSVYVPDVVCAEKGLFNSGRDVREDFEVRPQNALLYEELSTLKCLRPVKSPEKLAVVGKKILEHKWNFTGTKPSIKVELTSINEECDEHVPISIRINDFISKSINNSDEIETYKLNIESKPIIIVKVNENSWDEIVIENLGEISVRYKWEKEEYVLTKYDDISKELPIKCFYFDTRPLILGPGQIKYLPVLFRPTRIGPHTETWIFEAGVLGRLESVARIKMVLQGCAVPAVDYKTLTLELQKTLLSERAKILCSKLTNRIVQRLFPVSKSVPVERYQFHEGKMKYLYRKLQVEKPLSIDELSSQCMQLEQSVRDEFLDLIGQTAVTLLKKEVITGHNGMTRRKLFANKTMFVALDFIDLILNTYESDYDEACLQLEQNVSGKNSPKLLENLGNEVSVDLGVELTNDYAAVRTEWLEMVDPIIHKWLEWAAEQLFEYDIRWTECKHNN